MVWMCVFVSQLPSPASHGLHSSFQRIPEGDDDRHGPGHHEYQGQQDGPDRNQEDPQEDTL